MKNEKIIKILSLVAVLAPVFYASANVTLPPNTGLPTGTLTVVISNFTKWILGIFGFLAIISFVVTGIMYLLAVGDDKKQETAKKQMTWSIIGVVIGLAGYIVINAVDSLFRGSNNRF